MEDQVLLNHKTSYRAPSQVPDLPAWSDGAGNGRSQSVDAPGQRRLQHGDEALLMRPTGRLSLPMLRRLAPSCPMM